MSIELASYTVRIAYAYVIFSIKNNGGKIQNSEFIRDILINTDATQRGRFSFQIVSVGIFKIKLDLH